MKYKALIFDLDGTLLNTLQDLADSMNTVLHKYGYPTHDTENYRYFVGAGMRNLIIKTLPYEHRNDETISLIHAGMIKEYEKRWAYTTKPYPGIPEMLDVISASGIPISIFSNKPHAFTLKTVRKLLPKWDFKYVFGARENVPIKPDPTSALEIADKLGISPDTFVYIGDSGVDMQTAVSAGMHPIGVSWGFRKPQELLSSGAEHIINDPSELLDLLCIPTDNSNR